MIFGNVLVISNNTVFSKFDSLNKTFNVFCRNDTSLVEGFCDTTDIDVAVIDFEILKNTSSDECNNVLKSLLLRNISFVVVFDEFNSVSDLFCEEFNPDDYFVNPDNILEVINRLKLLLAKKNSYTNNVMAKNKQTVNSNSEELENIKTDFFYMMSTELRNPLNGIVGFVDMLEDSIRNKTHLKLLSYVKQASDRLIAVSDMSMLLTSIKGKRYIAKKGCFVAKTMLEDILLSKKIDIKDKKLKIKINSKDPFATIVSDSKLMSLSVGRIISDAIDNSPIKGKITIDIIVNADDVEFIVSDKGFSFTETKKKYLYSYFENGDKARLHEGRFTPGLIIANEFMNVLEGKIKFENNPEGGVHISLIFPKSLAAIDSVNKVKTMLV